MAGIPRDAEHLNGTATTTSTEVTFTGPSRAILIQNTNQSAANNLLVSFDGGSNFKTLRRLESISLELKIPSFWIKASAGTVDYESVVTHD